MLNMCQNSWILLNFERQGTEYSIYDWNVFIHIAPCYNLPVNFSLCSRMYIWRQQTEYQRHQWRLRQPAQRLLPSRQIIMVYTSLHFLSSQLNCTSFRKLGPFVVSIPWTSCVTAEYLYNKKAVLSQGNRAMPQLFVAVIKPYGIYNMLTRKPSWRKGKRATAVRVWRPLAKKSTANLQLMVNSNRGRITYGLRIAGYFRV